MMDDLIVASDILIYWEDCNELKFILAFFVSYVAITFTLAKQLIEEWISFYHFRIFINKGLRSSFWIVFSA